MPLSQIRKKALKTLTGIMTSDKAMQIMADPRAQKVMMSAFQLQAQVSSTVNKTVATAAGQLNLVTRKDLSALKRRMRSLENQVKKLQGATTNAKSKAKKA